METVKETQSAHSVEKSALPAYVKIASLRTFTISVLMLVAMLILPVSAQESPYIVTYDHYLEEPGNLEVEYFSTLGTQRGGNDFHAYWMEFEYGAKAWWTTEFYLDGQITFGDSTIFTGFRWENRINPFQREHFVNPVLYVEYEQINEATRSSRKSKGTTSNPITRCPTHLLAKPSITNSNSSCCSRRHSRAGISP
ncbi:MAG TPA: hypothetical protein VGS27_17065 [Candidatus Sulfotelmatobacter sp.]|nr:hypothetical protein [Candidatus Sulfotelmatobacter sp.]